MAEFLVSSFRGKQFSALMSIAKMLWIDPEIAMKLVRELILRGIAQLVVNLGDPQGA